MKQISLTHGGNLFDIERKFGIKKEDIIDFSGNINPLGVPNSLIEAIKNNINLIGFYPDPDYVAMKQSIGEYVDCLPTSVVLGNGATEIISKVIRLIQPKKALTVQPTYSEYEKEIRLLGGTLECISLKENTDFKIDIENLLSHAKNGCDMLILCNPNNPTSTGLFKDEIEKICSTCKDFGTFVVVDETYVEFCDDAENISCTTLAKSYDNLFIIRGISKFFGTPGLRLGYGITSNSSILKQFEKGTDPWSINIFASIAGEVLFKDTDYIKKSKAFMKQEKEFLFNELSNIPYIKPFNPLTNFILCKINDKSLTGSFISSKLLDEKMLIRDTKNVFGLGDKFFRVCILSHENNVLLIDKLKTLKHF